MIKKCIVCGITFEAINGHQKFCSEECRQIQNKTNKDKWRRENTNIGKMEQKVCIVCGKPFISARNNRKVCSEECRRAHRKQLQKQRNQSKPNRRSWDEWVIEQRERNEKKKEESRRLREELKEAKKTKGICIVCGEKYETLNPSQVTCSSKCSKRWKYHKRDARLKGKIVDNDITLEALYNRDSGVCYLCGCKCNWNDKTITKEGYQITGQTYPTIEHVIPLALGGQHSWENIKLACFHCNSIKGATMPEDCKLEIQPLAKPTIKSKAVRQLSKEGEFICEYKSTIEAEKQTGIKQRGIQNCARGEVKSYRGYLWKYVGL